MTAWILGRRGILGRLGWLAYLVILVVGAGCGSLPRIDGISIDDVPNLLCEPEGSRSAAGEPRADPPDVVVHLLRGWGDLYSAGLDSLASELQADGVEAVLHGWPAWPEVSDEIIAELQASDPPGLVLIGHSFGGDDIVRVAEDLKAVGLGVRLLVLVDGTNPGPIPDNVDRCLQFYIPMPGLDTAPGILPGQPAVLAAGNTHTELVNVVLGFEGDVRAAWCVNHLGVDESQYVHERITDEIFALDAGN